MLLVLSATLAAAGANGQTASSPERDAQRVLAALPAKADAVIIVHNAAGQRSTAAGKQLTRLLDEAGSFAASRAAWGKLASQLGCSSEQAFDDLLGRQVVLVMRGLHQAEGPDWAVLTQVSAATERRLRDRLAPVPRGHIASLSVLGLEDGNYQLVIGRRPTDSAAGESRTPGAATMLLGPRGGGLFEEMAPSVLSAAHARLVAAAGKADMLAVLRSGEFASQRMTAISVSRTGDGWNASIVASPTTREAMNVQPWSRSIFDRLQQDSLIAVMGVAGLLNSGHLQESPAADGLRTLLPLPALAASLPAQDPDLRSGWFIRRVQIAQATRTSSNPSLVQAARIPYSSPASSSSSWALLWALEVRDPQQVVIQGDQLVAGIVASLRDEDGWLRLEVPALEQESRVLSLAEVLPPQSHLAALHDLFGPRAVLRWGLSRAADPYELFPAPPTHSTLDRWWLAALEPAEIRSADLARKALRGDAPGSRPTAENTRRWLSLGAIRPAQLLNSGAAAGELLAPMRPLRRVDSLEWEAWARDDGLIEGAIRLRMER
jgi:hypothetical protein